MAVSLDVMSSRRVQQDGGETNMERGAFFSKIKKLHFLGLK
jgi:hypothetical protein